MLLGMFTSPRFLLFISFFLLFIIWLIARKCENKYSKEYRSVDAIVPAFNEEVTIPRTLQDLLDNDYINTVVVVDDGSTDNTSIKVKELQDKYNNRVILVSQHNTGKAGAINHGLNFIKSKYVFLTDADIRIKNDNGLGYLIQALDDGATAVAGLPGSDMKGISFVGKIRASVKIAFATIRKCGGEILGGSSFCISGSVGMYRTDVLKEIKFSDRTKVEDLDFTWELLSRGYKVAQSAKAIVFSQEASTLKDDLKRWKRWISGYACCMRIHRKLLLSRIGLTCILPNFITGMFGIVFMIIPFLLFYPHLLKGLIIWGIILFFASAYTAYRNGKHWSLIIYSPLSLTIIFIVCFCWLRWGLYSLITGKEEGWNKVKRY